MRTEILSQGQELVFPKCQSVGKRNQICQAAACGPERVLWIQCNRNKPWRDSFVMRQSTKQLQQKGIQWGLSEPALLQSWPGSGSDNKGRALLFWETLPVVADFFAGRMSTCILRRLLASIFSIFCFSKALDRNFLFQSYYYFNFRKSWLAIAWVTCLSLLEGVQPSWCTAPSWTHGIKEALSHGPAHLSALPWVTSQTTPLPAWVPVSASGETQP